MADDVARIAQLEAEIRALRDAVEQRDRALDEAREQQAATTGILRALASAPTEAQRVLDDVVATAGRLLASDFVVLHRRVLDHMKVVAFHGSQAEQFFRAVRGAGVAPPPATREGVSGRALLDRQIVHVPDVALAEAEFPYTYETAGKLAGVRAQLAAPLLRGDDAIGTLSVLRFEPGPFTDQEVQLLAAFADEAAIAIENARLFSELQESNRQVTEALEQQTATASILGIIASSPTDVQPVLDAIVTSAQRLTDASTGVLWRIEGNVLRGAAITADQGLNREQLLRSERPIEPSVPNGRAALERRTIRVDDMANPGWEVHPETAAAQRRAGFRSLVSAPLLRDEQVIGVLSVTRTEVRPFSDDHVALLETFADQAVIAIENARLFEELERSNRDLSEALEQQTATAEVLRVIAASPTALPRVFQTLAQSAFRLCDALGALIWRVDGDSLRCVASVGIEGSAYRGREVNVTIPLAATIVSGRAVLDGRVIHVEDAHTDEMRREYPDSWGRGNRTSLHVPLLRDGVALGAIVVGRDGPRPFSAEQIALLETFADQAVIAIENARLFEELEQRNADLQESNRQVTEALEQQAATAEVLRVIASSPTDRQTVLQAIVESAGALCQRSARPTMWSSFASTAPSWSARQSGDRAPARRPLASECRSSRAPGLVAASWRSARFGMTMPRPSSTTSIRSQRQVTGGAWTGRATPPTMSAACSRSRCCAREMLSARWWCRASKFVRSRTMR
jgi:two-component system, NtrC family, sensor kinase